MRITLGVSALLKNSRGSVLLIQRKNAPSAGQWALPGGAVEVCESLSDACKREVKEETNLQCELISNLPIRVTRSRQGLWPLCPVDI